MCRIRYASIQFNESFLYDDQKFHCFIIDSPRNKAPASKAISGSSCTIDASHEVKAKRKQNVQPDDEDVLNIVKSLENVIKEEMTGGKEFNRAAIA